MAKEAGYDPDADILNPTGSVFCVGGSASYVSWDKVEAAAHIGRKTYVDPMNKGRAKVL